MWLRHALLVGTLAAELGRCIRQGDYRILYEIEDDILRVMVVKIGHRRDVYRS